MRTTRIVKLPWAVASLLALAMAGGCGSRSTGGVAADEAACEDGGAPTVNGAPTVTGAVVAFVFPGEGLAVTALAKDPDGDGVTFRPWAATCQGSFGPEVTSRAADVFASTTTFMARPGQGAGSCTLSVSARDHRGGVGTASVTFALGGPRFEGTPGPVLLAPGEAARFAVLTPARGSWDVAWSDGLSDPQRGTFSPGALGEARGATYTPARCVDLGLGDHAITVVATGTEAGSGHSASRRFDLVVRCPPAATGNVGVKVLAINDLHGQIGAGKSVGGRPAGSAAVLAAHLRTAMAGVEGRTIIAEAGDLVGASPAASALLQDEPTIMFMNQLANDRCGWMPPPEWQATGVARFDPLFDPGCNLVGVPGNHEFDEGVEELTRLLAGGNHAKGPFLEDPWRGARFPVVSANIRRDDGEPLFRPHVVKYLDGVHVGFIGATLSSTPTIVLPSGVTGFVFEDEVAAVNAQVRELQARGVHAIVVVLHDGASQTGSYTGPTLPGQGAPAALAAFVAQLDGDVDVLITAHTHNFANELVKNAAGRDVLVTQAFSAGTAYADIDLTVDGRTQDVVAATAKVVTTYASDVTPDPEALHLTTTAEARVAPLVGAVVGSTTATLSRTLTAGGESALGDLLAEAHRQAMGADLGITNPGGMRADLPATCATSPCPITWGDCFVTQPFANQVMRVTLTGAQLRAALEQQFAGWGGQTQTRMLQIAGFRYSWSASAPLGSRIVSLETSSGAPIDPAARYTVAMNNFLQGGGDGFRVLAGGTDVVPGPIDLDALIAYLGAQPGPVTPGLDGRATQLP